MIHHSKFKVSLHLPLFSLPLILNSTPQTVLEIRQIWCLIARMCEGSLISYFSKLKVHAHFSPPPYRNKRSWGFQLNIWNWKSLPDFPKRGKTSLKSQGIYWKFTIKFTVSEESTVEVPISLLRKCGILRRPFFLWQYFPNSLWIIW